MEWLPEVLGERQIVDLDAPERKRAQRESLLHAPMIQADLVASVAQTVSPQRPDVLKDLAETLRGIVEPHVHTLTPKNLIVKPERDSDEFLGHQGVLEMELSYALCILGFLKPEERKKLWDEHQRLFMSAGGKITKHQGYEHFLTVLLRKASMYYLSTAWQTAPGTKLEKHIKELLEESIQLYQSTASVIRDFQENCNGVRLDEKRKEMGAGILAVALGDEAERVGHPELRGHAENIALNDHMMLLDDVIFGLARAYALQGDMNALKTTLAWADMHFADMRIEHAPIIVDSMKMLREEMERAKGKPFVPDSPPIVLECARNIVTDIGKRPPLIHIPPERDIVVPEF